MQATRSPRQMRDVTPDRAASVVIPSNTSPGPSPYMGWKWSKPQTPSKPSSSASCTRRTISSHGRRCWATSSPKRMSVPLVEVGHEPGRPLGEIGRSVVPGLVVDRRPVLGNVLDRGFRALVYVTLRLGDEDAGEATEPGGIDLARHRAVLVSKEGGHRRDEVWRHL